MHTRSMHDPSGALSRGASLLLCSLVLVLCGAHDESCLLRTWDVSRGPCIHHGGVLLALRSVQVWLCWNYCVWHACHTVDQVARPDGQCPSYPRVCFTNCRVGLSARLWFERACVQYVFMNKQCVCA